MKPILLLTLTILTVLKVQAQAGLKPDTAGIKKPGTTIRICMPSRGQLINPPLCVVRFDKKDFKLKSLNDLKPSDIDSISVLKDSVSTSKYGADARYGVVLIYIDHNKHPEAVKNLKRIRSEQ